MAGASRISASAFIATLMLTPAAAADLSDGCDRSHDHGLFSTAWSYPKSLQLFAITL
jgi:hypothetical protein